MNNSKGDLNHIRKEAIDIINEGDVIILTTNEKSLLYGTPVELLTCLGCIIWKLNNMFPRETIEEIVQLGFDECRAEGKQSTNNSMIIKMIKKIFENSTEL